MKHERDPDLQFPDEKDLEERVKRMMDLDAPSAPEVSRPPLADPSTPNPKKISVNTENVNTENVNTEKQTRKLVSKKPLVINVDHFDEHSEDDTPGAPPLMGSDSEPDSVPQSATPIPKKAAPKSINITHFTEEPTAVEEPEVVPEEVLEMPDTVENPLIPTDKLTGTIVSKPPKPKRPKKVPIVDKAAEDVPPADNYDVEAEIAAAFGDDETDKETPATDEMDELAAENVAEDITDTPTAPPLPTTDEKVKKPVEDTDKKPVKKDPFTPLTNIRPKSPTPDLMLSGLKLDDNATSQAVDEIVIADADKLLQISDDPTSTDEPDTKLAKTGKPAIQRIKRRRNKHIVAAILVIIVLALLIFGLALPANRFKVLNAVGVRAEASIIVTDHSTNLPLKNVNVSLGGNSKLTDSNGYVRLNGLRLGLNELKISRKAFAPSTTMIGLDFGSNRLNAVGLIPTGKQYKVMIADFLSDKAVKSEVSNGQAVATTDDNGLATLTLDAQSKPFEITVMAGGYRTDKVSIDPTALTATKLSLVSARKYAYVSSKSGTEDVYKADLDGKNEQVVLKGIAKKRGDSVLIASPTDDVVAFVSVKDNTGSLTTIDLKTNASNMVVKATNIQLIGWSGEHLTYVQTLADAKPADTNRQQLMDYNYKSKKNQTLATANYFNSVLSAASVIYYAPSSAYQPVNNVGLFKINPDGSGKQSLLSQEVWNIYRTAYEHLSLSVHQDWYDYKLGAGGAVKQSAAPSALINTLFIDSPDGQHSLWVDGNTSLMLYDKNTAKNVELVLEKGLSYPVRWFTSTTIIYRSSSSQRSTDYADSLDGNNPKKIHDVDDVAGLSLWQIH